MYFIVFYSRTPVFSILGYDKCHGSGGCKAGCGDPDPEMVWYGVHAAYWDGTRGAVVAVARGEVAAGVVVSPGGLVSIDPSSGVVSPLDSGVDSGAAFVLGKGGGLSAFGAGLLVFPLVSAWDWVHSFQVVNTSTGVARHSAPNKHASRSLWRALLLPKVNTGSLYRGDQGTLKIKAACGKGLRL